MKIAVLSYGTRGDVQPLVALACALQARGHDVVVGAPENHVAFVRAAGLRAAPIAGSSDEILSSPQGKAWIADGDLLALARAINRAFRELSDAVEVDVEAATADVDVVVSGMLVSGMARLFAELRGVPWVVAHLCPGRPTSAWPIAMLDMPRGAPGLVNRAASTLLLRGIWWMLHDVDDAIRDRRGLPRAQHEPSLEATLRGRPSLHLMSPLVVPPPEDHPADEVFTGFCALPKVARPAGENAALAELESFLTAGPPPVYLGLGSMPLLAPEQTLELVIDVVGDLGVRAVLGGDFGAVADVDARLPSHMRRVGNVDHEALFPRCAAVMHHGGAGSTHTGLRAGRPTLVCSVLGDQPFWGRVIAARGLGAWTRFRTLNRERLKRGLARLFDPDVVARAVDVGAALRAEPEGAAAAAARLEAIVAGHAARST